MSTTDQQEDRTASDDAATASWGWQDIFWTFVAGTLLGLAGNLMLISARDGFGWSFSPTAEFALLAVVLYGSLALAAWYFALHRHKLPPVALGFRAVGPGVLVSMIPIAGAVFVADALIVALVSLAFPSARNAQADLFPGPGEFGVSELVSLLALVAVVAPIVEELLFRGLIYQYLRRHQSLAVAVSISAAAFAVVHFIPVLFPSLFGLGVVLALLVERYGSIYPAIVLHALNNTIAVLLVYAASGRAS